MAFYYDHKKDYHSQWRTYLQNQSYVEDITKSINCSSQRQTRDFSGIISNQTKEINETIRNASREQILAIQESTNAVCGTLNSGFELLSDNLQEISFGIDGLRNEVSNMSAMLDWKLSLLIESQRISNLLLGNIAIILRIPDIQKERQYHIEQGIKFLKNAIIDNDFYEDSLTNLLKAEKIEPTDFFALHRIGLIYMYSLKHLELKKAEIYFKKAAKYAIAETNTGASVTTNFLAGELSKNLSQQIPSTDTIKLQAAEAYMFAGRCCYIQGNFSEASELAGKAFKIVPQLVEAGFTQAKALSADNNETQAATVLERVINTDRFYSLKTLSDLDLAPKEPIRKTLEKLRQEAIKAASDVLIRCKAKILTNSKGLDLLNKIERLTNQKTYLSCKKAIDLLNKKYSYSFIEAIEKNSSGKWDATIKPKTVSYSIEELIDYENVLINKLNIVKELIRKKDAKSNLLSEMKSLQSVYISSQSKLTGNVEDSKNFGLALLGGVVLFSIGVYLWIYGMSGSPYESAWDQGFIKSFSPLFGTGFIIGGLALGFPALIGLIGASISVTSLASNKNSLSVKENKLREDIANLDIEIARLENS